MYRFHLRSIQLLAISLRFFSALSAQWATDPMVNNPICTYQGTQYDPAIVSDGTGGAIIVWSDQNTGNYDIFAQRISTEGNVLWTLDGNAICTATGNQSYPTIVSDDAGGAIIAWSDFRATGDIYAQRVSPDGVPLWAANGVPICTATGVQTLPAMIADGFGGAIITYQDSRSGLQDIYVQRINGSGVTAWTVNGIALCTASDNQGGPKIVTDGLGGAVVAWEDRRNGVDYDIYARRVSSAGVAQWTANGVMIAGGSSNQSSPAIIPYGTGGAIIAYTDYSSTNLYASLINGDGTFAMFQQDVCNASGLQKDPNIVQDGSGGAIIVWRDERNVTTTGGDIYVQRLRSDGIPLWTANGIQVSTSLSFDYSPVIISDGAGGAIVAWHDGEIYARRINPNGQLQWAFNGVSVSTAPSQQQYPVMAQGLDGSAIIAWEDFRGASQDIYAQYVDRHGFLGLAQPVLSNVLDVPGDQGGRVSVRWMASYLDAFPSQTVYQYRVWRGVDGLSVPSGIHALQMHEIPDSVMPNERIYLQFQTQDGPIFWELLETMPAQYFPAYSFTAPTLSDSSVGGTAITKFLVSAHTTSPYVFWNSNIDSGYSVDNLSPVPPANAQATPLGNSIARLRWDRNRTDPDVGSYRVYRSSVSGFPLADSTRVLSTADTSVVDTPSVAGVTYYYRITTVDIHGNESAPSPQLTSAAMSTASIAMLGGWNMVSVPLSMLDYTKTTLFPTAISDAFAYQGSYVVQSVLENGDGYWLRFGSPEGVLLSGFVRDVDTIDVASGWNMIGSISSPVDVTTIASIPGGIVTSQFFGYNGAYFSATTIEPGRGYWIRTTQAGQLILATAPPKAGQIQIIPTQDMPPLPPVQTSVGDQDGLPTEFALKQNYPNPFNPSTVIGFDLPVQSQVRLRIYDVLGQEVVQLVDEQKSAGRFVVEWNGANSERGRVTSGLYFYTMEAQPASGGTGFVTTKKMLLLK